MKATTREDLNLKEDETMCEKCVHEDICRREQCGEPFCVIRSCFDFEEKRLRGKWIETDDDLKISDYACSVCGQLTDLDDPWNFCPSCGADMRGTGK